jgi:hypothetical protein
VYEPRVLFRVAGEKSSRAFELREDESVVSGRAKRILVYTTSLLIAPMLVMPFTPGSREFGWAIMGYGAILICSSFYVVRGEMAIKPRSLLGNKLLATSLITLLFGIFLLVGSIVHLS